MKTTSGQKFLSPKGKQVIALTGGIGSGKSFVLKCLAKLGFNTISADDIVHKLLRADGAAYDLVGKIAPEAITKEGIDRNLLGIKVFGNKGLLAELEGILHPLVQEYAEKEISKARWQGNRQSLIYEVPLLFQTNQLAVIKDRYDGVILTLCPPNKQVSRAIARNNMTAAKLSAIIEAQGDYWQYAKLSDWVVYTGATELSTYRQVFGFCDEWIKRNSFGY
jgi:dephospho-CoA kinase